MSAGGHSQKAKKDIKVTVLHIEFTDGEIFAIDTGSNVANPEFESKIDPADVHINLLFRWKSDTPSN